MEMLSSPSHCHHHQLSVHIYSPLHFRPDPNSTPVLHLPGTTRRRHCPFTIYSCSHNQRRRNETPQNPETTTTTTSTSSNQKESFRKHNSRSTALLLRHLSGGQQQPHVGTEEDHSVSEEDKAKLLEMSLVRKRTPQFPGSIYIQSPSDVDVNSSLPPLQRLFSDGGEDEEMLLKALEIRRNVTVEIFKEAMGKGKFGITYSDNLVSRLPEFIDYVMIKAASMKQFPEYSQSTFNVRARAVIDDSNVVPLIRYKVQIIREN